MALELNYGFFTAVIVFVVTALLLRFYHSKAAKFMRTLTGPPRLPLVGNMFQLNVPNEVVSLKLLKEWPDNYGPRFGMQFGPRFYFTSLTQSDVEKLLSSSVHIRKGDEYKFIGAWLKEGLLTSTGSKWFHRRKMITPSFHFKILEEFLDVFNAQSKICVDIVAKDSSGGKELDVCQYITRCALDIICETAMGKPINAQQVKDSPYVTAIYGICDLIQHRTVRPWLYPDILWNLSPSGRLQKKYLEILHGFTDRVIKERKAELMGHGDKMKKETGKDDSSEVFMGKKRAVAFMDMLLQYQMEHPTELSDLDIREETDTFMFEGHDTTSASLAWTVHLLGAYPECQKRVHEELDAIFGNDKGRPITPQDLAQMKYLECCIKESLRLYPSVPFIDRHLTQDLKLDDGTTLPAGFNFPIIIARLHRDPEVFPQPDKFKPERFFTENATGRHPYAYIPFSAGPRNCIGQKFALMEEKVVLGHLFRNFNVKSLDKEEDIILTTELILRPKNGLRIQFTKRVGL